jgi:hypothetical protein
MFSFASMLYGVAETNATDKRPAIISTSHLENEYKIKGAGINYRLLFKIIAMKVFMERCPVRHSWFQPY